MLDDTLETRVLNDVEETAAADLVEATPIGSVEFCAAVARAQGATMPLPMDYPAPLMPYLGRSVRHGTLAESAGLFTKPLQTKAFEAFLAPSSSTAHKQALVDRNLDPSTACWISEPVTFVHEWRAYVALRQVLGVAQYDLGEADANMSSLEHGKLLEMIEAWSDAPCAYALDVGRTDRGEFKLVEVNDGWGTGYYPSGSLKPAEYARWCAMRWAEITGMSQHLGG